MLLRVLSVRLLLQFAPSGVGKTSLLNAGLFPRLRENNLFPVAIRLNEPSESLTDAVRRSLKESAHAMGLVDPVIPADGNRLWDLFAGVQLWSADLLLLTPVLVFEQFEEVFTLRDGHFRQLFGREIGALSLGRSTEPIGGVPGAPAPDVKIILSLREEYLGKLEEFSASVPDLFHERLRLCPMTPDEAREAIVEPARLPGDHWLSPTFGFEDACVDELIDFIDGTSDTVRVIEPLTLQLICQRAEVLASDRANVDLPHPILRFADFGGLAGLESLVENFFSSELQKLPAPRAPRRARKMFEEGLLDATGKRLMLEEDQIKRRYGLDRASLEALVESRLLRREPRNESVFYEISHDRLTEAIAHNRKPTLPRWVVPTLVAGGIVVVLVTMVSIIGWKAARQISQARGEVENALSVLLNEELGGRLREVGLTDALRHVLTDAKINETSNSKARALSLRHEGDIAVERSTIADARSKFLAALGALDDLSAGTEGSLNELVTERARILNRLGFVTEDAGEVSAAERYYEQSVQVWNDYLEGDRPPQAVIEASEDLMRLGRVQSRIGNGDRAQDTYTKALRLALQVVTATAEHPPNSHSDYLFDQGRAMQVYADAASQRATREKEWGAAYLLARESLRLRPLSSSARRSVAYATGMFGSRATDPRIAENLLLEAKREFEELARWDPENRRLQRERASVQLLSAERTAECAENATCRRTLGPQKLEEAHTAALASIGQLRELATKDSESSALKHDVGWGYIVHGRILYALGRQEDGLGRIDESLAASRAAIADPADLESRLAIPIGLSQKAALLAAADPSQALAILNQARHEIDGLSVRLVSVQMARSHSIDAMIRPLKTPWRIADAKHIEHELRQVLKRISKPWSAAQTLAQERSSEGTQLRDAASKLSGHAALPGFQRALDAFKIASTEYPFEFGYWNNQLITYQSIRRIQEQLETEAHNAARASASDAGNDGRSSVDGELETTLRGALTAAWMARVISTEDLSADAWKDLYEARRGLIQFLRRHGRNDEAMAQLRQSLPEAEEYARLKRDSAEALLLLSDVNELFGRLRQETKQEGWEEPLHSAVAYRERVRRFEPHKSEHSMWIGDLRRTLGDYLNESGRKAAAAAEYRLAVQACRESVRLGGPVEERTRAQTCVDELAALGYR